MKDHSNLDDLIIDSTDANQKNNLKGILTTVILIIIVLIIAIFSTKILLKEPEKPLINEQNYTQTANPDLQLETNNTIKEDTNTTANNANEQSVLPASTDINTSSNDSNKTKAEAVNPKPIQAPKILDRKSIFKKSNVETTSGNKESNKSTIKPNKVNTDIKNEIYYIQVGSFTSKPNETFLSIIKNSEYNYQIKTFPNGKTKISKFLIGPYDSRTKAEKELVNIKNRINKSAFIVKQ
ncbi:MAG: SPOR domain-containing protein [Sulfurovaceae bacterium]|nr:SPOR domain-containing protein [Sulfurovaceae bacterium]